MHIAYYASWKPSESSDIVYKINVQHSYLAMQVCLLADKGKESEETLIFGIIYHKVAEIG